MIKHIAIEIGGRTVELTLEEARTLHQELGKLFGPTRPLIAPTDNGQRIGPNIGPNIGPPTYIPGTAKPLYDNGAIWCESLATDLVTFPSLPAEVLESLYGDEKP